MCLAKLNEIEKKIRKIIICSEKLSGNKCNFLLVETKIKKV